MDGLTISRVQDEDGLRSWHGIAAASQDADYEALPSDPIEEARPMLAGRYGDEDVRLHLGVAGGEPVATALTRMPAYDNLETATVLVRVHPDRRREGFGRAMAEAVLAELKASGRPMVLFEIPTAIRGGDGSPGEVLAAALGARRVTAERRMMLDLNGLDGDRLSALWQEASAASVGYSRVAWRDRTPEDRVSDLAVLLTAMSTDPPQGELELEPEQWSVERFRRLEQSYLERGRTRLFVAAQHDASGELVGYTDIGVPTGSSVGYQWDTIVRVDHRGHRLGVLLKIANLHQIRTELPDVRYINTWNAESNTHMIAVNDALGFRLMEGWSEWQLDL